jgi:hypothetical protein
MLLLAGVDGPVVDRVAETLEATGRDFIHVEMPDPSGLEGKAQDEAPGLFELALQHRASTLVVVEPLRRVGLAASPIPGRFFDEVLRATRAPEVKLLVLVTSRGSGDGGLQTLRRDGIPYVIVQVDALVDLTALEAEVKGRRVLIPADFTARTAAAPMDEVVRLAALAASSDDLQGRLLTIAPAPVDAWTQLLAARGARPKVVKPWRARVGRWLGELELGALPARTRQPDSVAA